MNWALQRVRTLVEASGDEPGALFGVRLLERTATSRRED
jgi:hypothetical protein